MSGVTKQARESQAGGQGPGPGQAPKKPGSHNLQEPSPALQRLMADFFAHGPYTGILGQRKNFCFHFPFHLHAIKIIFFFCYSFMSFAYVTHHQSQDKPQILQPPSALGHLGPQPQCPQLLTVPTVVLLPEGPWAVEWCRRPPPSSQCPEKMCCVKSTRILGRKEAPP